jgi:hypothetical protein
MGVGSSNHSNYFCSNLSSTSALRSKEKNWDLGGRICLGWRCRLKSPSCHSNPQTSIPEHRNISPRWGSAIRGARSLWVICWKDRKIVSTFDSFGVTCRARNGQCFATSSRQMAHMHQFSSSAVIQLFAASFISSGSSCISGKMSKGQTQWLNWP